ncbi:hypothetical protein LTS18_002236, partial [Coniosporium uncinatum]
MTQTSVSKPPKWDQNPTEWVSRSKPGIGWANPADVETSLESNARQARTQRIEPAQPSDEALDDYIANMREYGEEPEIVGQEETTDQPMSEAQLAIPHTDGNMSIEEQSGRTNGGKPPLLEQDEWDATLLDVFDDMSTSEEGENTVIRVLNKRERITGVQYLVVHEGFTTDDAKWLLGSSLTADSTVQLIRKFEETQVFVSADSSDDDDWESDEDEDDDDDDDDDEDDDEEDDLLDEADLIRRRIEQMDDEKIARLLAKQEELGMGSDELMIFDDDDIDLGAFGFGGFGSMQKSSKRKQKKGSK